MNPHADPKANDFGANKEIRLAIIGSRSFDDYELAKWWFNVLYAGHNITCIISGGAVGADSIGAKIADEFGLKTQIYLPDWDKFGKSAGFRRNETIIQNCDMVLAAWDGISRGTAHSLSLAKKLKKPTVIVYF